MRAAWRGVGLMAALLAPAGAALAGDVAGGASLAPSGASATAASSATPSATTSGDPRGLVVKPGLEIFGQYSLTLREDIPGELGWYHEFDVPRVHASLTADWHGVIARVLLEGVRSASQGALLGVGGDSLLVRLREAFAGYAPVSLVDVRLGVVPTLLVPALESVWGLRAVAPTSFESSALYAPADLGVSMRAHLPKGHGMVGVGLYNGEGYTGRELNRGKSFEAAFEVHPLATLPSAQPLAVVGALVIGSTGTGSAQSNRYTAGFAWAGDRIGASSSFTWAQGIVDAPTQEALLVDAFVRGEPVLGLLLGARASYLRREASNEASHVWNVLVTGGYRVRMPPAVAAVVGPHPLDLLLALSRSAPGEAARLADPKLDSWDGRVVARVVY